MTQSGKRWILQDRYDNVIYLTEERWQHIIDAFNHSELADYEDYLKITIQQGRRRQEPLNPRKYRYYHSFDDLPDDVNHIVVIVLFGFDINESGQTVPNNYVATTFFKHIGLKG
jgi:predicted nucleotidyltransferase